MKSLWRTDLKDLTESLQNMCPVGWDRYGPNLLENADVLEQLFSNPHYLKIGPAAEMVKQMRKACNALRDCGGPFIPQAYHLAAKRAQAHGSLTVTTTHLAYNLKKVLPQGPELTRASNLKTVLGSAKQN